MMNEEVLQVVLNEIAERLSNLEKKPELSTGELQDGNKLLTVAVEKLYDEFGSMKNTIVQNGDKVTRNIETLSKQNKASALPEISQKLEKVHSDVRNIPQQITIQHTHEHKHINAGVRFMLITLIAVILSASEFCWYCLNKYNEYKEFSDSYEWYTKQIQWNKDFLNFMMNKNPKDTKAYRQEHPMPE